MLCDSTVSVLYGDGMGNFQTQASAFSVGSTSTPYGVAVGDFNNDGRFDIVAADFVSKTIHCFACDCIRELPATSYIPCGGQFI